MAGSNVAKTRPTEAMGRKDEGKQQEMRTLPSKQIQSQILLSALFVAALSFITLAASFAEVPAESSSAAALVHE